MYEVLVVSIPVSGHWDHWRYGRCYRWDIRRLFKHFQRKTLHLCLTFLNLSHFWAYMQNTHSFYKHLHFFSWGSMCLIFFIFQPKMCLINNVLIIIDSGISRNVKMIVPQNIKVFSSYFFLEIRIFFDLTIKTRSIA